jgi:hypothetical protein
MGRAEIKRSQTAHKEKPKVAVVEGPFDAGIFVAEKSRG